MKVPKIARVAKAITDVAKSDNRGEALGNVVAGAVTVAHPVIGTAAAPLIKKGVNAAYDKVESTVTDPEFQERAKGIADNAMAKGRAAVGGLLSRASELRNGLSS